MFLLLFFLLQIYKKYNIIIILKLIGGKKYAKFYF